MGLNVISAAGVLYFGEFLSLANSAFSLVFFSISIMVCLSLSCY